MGSPLSDDLFTVLDRASMFATPARTHGSSSRSRTPPRPAPLHRSRRTTRRPSVPDLLAGSSSDAGSGPYGKRGAENRGGRTTVLPHV